MELPETSKTKLKSNMFSQYIKLVTCANATDGTVGGGDEGVGAQVDVQQRGIGALNQNSLTRV